MRFMGRKKANITLSGGESNKKSNRVWGRQVCPSEESGLEQITAAHFMRRKKGKKNSVQRKRPFFRAAAALQVFVLAGVLLFAAVALSGCGAKDKGSFNRYEIDAVFSESDMTVEFIMTADFLNRSGGTISEVCFNFYPNAYRESATYSPVSAQKRAKAYPNGASYGKGEITEARVGKTPAPFALAGEDQTFLRVEVGSLKNGERAKITLRGKTTLSNCLHRTGYGDKTVNLGEAFPVLAVCRSGAFYECLYENIGDPFVQEVADYTVRFTAPEEYTVAHTGRETASFAAGGNVTHTYAEKNARSFAMVLSKEFTAKVGKTAAGAEVTCYAFTEERAAAILQTSVQSIDLYAKKFGAYPYSTYAAAETEFTEGGMEYTGLSFLSADAEEKEIAHISAHEAAHQWWYGVVGVDQIEEGYLDESLAEYSAVLFFEAYPAYKKTRQELYNAAETSYRLYADVYEQLHKNKNTAMRRPLGAFLGAYEYYELVYVKGVLLWENYRVSVGDKKFFTALRYFYDKNKFGIASTEDLYAALARSGAGGEGLIASFLDGSAVI